MIRILSPDLFIKEIKFIKSLIGSKRHTDININFCSEYGDTIFHYAVRNNDNKLLSWLLKKFPNLGSEVIYSTPLNAPQTVGYNTRNSDSELALEIALLDLKIDISKLFIQHKEKYRINSNYNGSTLHLALIIGNDHIAKKLIQNKKIPLNDLDSNGYRPIQLALLNNRIDIVKFLIQQGGETLIALDYEGSNLHLAVIIMDGHIAAKIIQLNKTQINAYDSNYNTPLHLAFFNNHPEIAMLLIKSGAQALITDINGNTAFHLATKKGYINIIEKLLKNKSSDDKNKDGETALEIALLNNQTEIAKLFIQQHTYIASNYEGSSLHLAVINRDRHLIEILIQRNQVQINAYDSVGNTALHAALLSNQPEIAKLLIEKGAKILVANICGNTALHLAVKKGYTDIVAQFVAKNLDSHDKNEDGKTALDIAKEVNNLEIISLLNSQAVKKKNISSFAARERSRRIPWTPQLSKRSQYSSTTPAPM